LNAKPNKTELFDEILKRFFSRKDQQEFVNDYLDQFPVKTGSRLGNADKEQMKVDTSPSPELRIKIDLLSTFASSRLAKTELLELLMQIGQHVITLGEFNIAIDTYKKIIEDCKNHPPLKNFKANAYVSLAEIFSRQADWTMCRHYIKKALNIFNDQNDKSGAAKCNNLLGTIEGDCGRITSAKSYFEKSLELLENDKNNILRGMIEINLGIINNIQGNFDEALAYYKRALVDFEKANDIKRIAEIKHNIGMTYLRKQEYATALSQFDQSISASLKVNYMQTLGISYLSKADIYTRLNDFNLASAFANKAMEICFRTNDKLSIADLYKIKGVIQKNLKNFGLAENYLLTSIRLNRDLGNLLNEAEAAYELGILYSEKKMTEESTIHLNKALNYYKKIKADNEINEIKSYLPN
jgi:tetratricopeptide (TPR) repeat protein